MTGETGAAPPSMTFGAHTFGLAWEMDAPEAVEALAAAGFDAVELIAMPPHFDPRRITGAQAAQLRARAEAARSRLLAVDLPSNDVNLVSTSQDVVDFAVESYIATIRRAAEIGIAWVVVLPGRRHLLLPPPDRRLFAILEGAMDRLVREAERCSVRLLMENHPQTLLPTGSDMAGFLARRNYGLVDALFDTANAVAAGDAAAPAIAALAPHLVMVHVSDTPAGQWRHDPIGTGSVDFEGVKRELDRIAFSGPVVAEIIALGGIDQLLKARAALEARGWTFSAEEARRAAAHSDEGDAT